MIDITKQYLECVQMNESCSIEKLLLKSYIVAISLSENKRLKLNRNISVKWQ